MARKLSNEQIVSMRQSGVSPKVIAQHAGLSRSRVSHIAPLKKRVNSDTPVWVNEPKVVRISTPDGLGIPYFQTIATERWGDVLRASGAEDKSWREAEQIRLNKQWLMRRGFVEVDGNWFQTEERLTGWQRIKRFFTQYQRGALRSF